MTEADAFLLSRVYKQGWSAARKMLADGLSEADEARAKAANPYGPGPENERWAQGFEEALQKKSGSFGKAGGSSWKPALKG